MIDPKRVNEILMDCLFKPEELENGKPKEGIEWTECCAVKVRLGLVNKRLKSHEEEIKKMLEQLPDEFKKSGGNGWSFLNFCKTKEDKQWGEHHNGDELIALGIGLGLVEFQLPREMWATLPGGVPYVVVDL